MQPIRFVCQRGSRWYNLADYINLLIDTGALRARRPSARRKRDLLPKEPYEAVVAKLNRLKPIYQWQTGQDVYVDWVVFEYLQAALKPFLIEPVGSCDPTSMFRLIQAAIDHADQVSPLVASYFSELTGQLDQ